MDAKLLRSDDVADILGVDPHTLAVWRCTGMRVNAVRLELGSTMGQTLT